MALNFSKEVITLGANKITDKTFTFFKQGFRLNGAIGEPEYRDVTVSGVDVLNLPNAKADGLNYCKLYGKCEQRNLPEGYTEVEYLRSSGTQWIDTGYKPNTNIKFEISGTQSNSDSALFGISELFFCFDNSNATYYNFFGGSVGSFLIVMKNIPVVLTMSASDGIVINGTKYKSLTAGPATANYSMALFGRRNNSTGAIDKLGNHIIKYAKIYESNILIHNYIPCRRNSDSVLGMYDTVTGNFLTNAGTGTFIAGNDVVPTPTRPLNIICNNGVVKVSPNLFDKSIFAGDSDFTITYTSYQVPNGTYTMSSPDFPIVNNGTNVFFLAGNVNTGASSANNGVWANNPHTITVTDGYYTVAHRYEISGVGYNKNHPKDYNWQIEKGDTATTYMPYKQVYIDGTTETVEDSLNNTATAENLLAVDNYKDVQEVLTGSVTRNFAIKVLDGTEEWAYQGVHSRLNIEIGDLKAGVRNIPIACTHYQAVTDGREITDVPNNSIYSIVTPSRISIKTNQYTSVDTFTSFLQQQYANGTPVIVVYQTSTPTTSTVTAQTLTTKKGTNTIEITQASLTGLPLEVSYKAGVTVTITQIENANLDNQVTVTIGG